jgi:hypothetical protein
MWAVWFRFDGRTFAYHVSRVWVLGLEFDDEMSASRLMWFFVYFGKPGHNKLKLTIACFSKTGSQNSIFA